MTHTAGFNAGIEAAGPFWCVHIIGPDDIHAAPDFETAWAWAEAANKVIAPHADERDVLWRCTVAIWPGDATSHADDLKRGGRSDDIDFPLLVEALKRPEPSEADTQKIGEAMREAVRNVCKGPTLSDELTDGQYAALFRAALKAMEGE